MFDETIVQQDIIIIFLLKEETLTTLKNLFIYFLKKLLKQQWT